MDLRGKQLHTQQIRCMRWVINVRWLAVAGSLAAAGLLRLLTAFDLTALAAIAVVVTGYNAVALLYTRLFASRGPLVRPGELNLVLNLLFALDVVVLGVVIHRTGGTESPLLPVYLVLVPAFRCVLSRRATFAQATLAVALLGAAFAPEYTGYLDPSLRMLGRGGPHLHTHGAHVAQVLFFQACFLYLGVYLTDRMRSHLRRSQNAEQQAWHMALTDALTGLYNRRHLYRVLEQELARSQRYGHALSVLMLDLDDFKRYNDRYGHLAGDEVLRHLAKLIQSVIRDSDIAFRYGGEEFVLVLPETPGHAALILAERLRQAVATCRFTVHGHVDAGQVTISVGVATYPRDAQGVEDLIHAADTALLQAKRHKNRVCVHSLQQRSYALHALHTSVMHAPAR